MMLTWLLDAGFRTPLMNREVLDLDGRRLAIVDLLDVESGRTASTTARQHRGRARHRRDVERAEVLRDVGLEGFTIVAGDSVDVQVQRMRAARKRALWLPEGKRQWRVGAHVPMKQLMRPLTIGGARAARLECQPPDDDWGTESG